MIYVISTIIVLGLLVFVHELGHFLAAKSVGIRVETFSLGFPPKMVGRTVGETEYRIGWVPLGGYVKMSGMIDESFDTEFAESEAQPWEYRSKKSWQKVYVSSAGVIMNLLLTAIIFFFLTWTGGINEVSQEPVINALTEGMPAQTAGLMEGDRILSLDGIRIDTWEQVTGYIHERAGIEVELSYMREGTEGRVTLMPVSQKTVYDGDIVEVGMIGIAAATVNREAGFGESVVHGLATTGYWLKLTWNSLGALVSGKESLKNVGGPIMIAQLAGESAKMGVASLFSFIAIISINLAFINILPIPALDGGHIIVALLEGLRRKEISTRAKLMVQQVGTFILLSLIVLVLYNDISRWFN